MLSTQIILTNAFLTFVLFPRQSPFSPVSRCVPQNSVLMWSQLPQPMPFPLIPSLKCRPDSNYLLASPTSNLSTVPRTNSTLMLPTFRGQQDSLRLNHTSRSILGPCPFCPHIWTCHACSIVGSHCSAQAQSLVSEHIYVLCYLFAWSSCFLSSPTMPM